LISTITLAEFIEQSEDRLERANVYNAHGDVRRIMREVLGDPGALHPRMALSQSQLDAQQEFVAQRCARRPFARLVGHSSFYGMRLKVDDGVFLPYPESEAVVEHAALLFEGKSPPEDILDLGTGGGCLLLTALQLFPNARGTGIDNNPKAIELARQNAVQLGLMDRCCLLAQDWASELDRKFDLVISNPPRVPSSKVQLLLPEMRDHDPRLAYDGGHDGLDYFRRTADILRQITNEGGSGIFQVSDADAVVRLFKTAGFEKITILNNYAGLPACVHVQI